MNDRESQPPQDGSERGVIRMAPERLAVTLKRLHELINTTGVAGAEIDQVSEEVAALPSWDTERAREVYVHLAADKEPLIRNIAAYHMDSLAEADSIFALPLWERLISDKEELVRGSAYIAMLNAAKLEGLRLDFRYFLPLFETYRAKQEQARESGEELEVMGDMTPEIARPADFPPLSASVG
jgi:hypothetical protein